MSDAHLSYPLQCETSIRGHYSELIKWIQRKDLGNLWLECHLLCQSAYRLLEIHAAFVG